MAKPEVGDFVDPAKSITAGQNKLINSLGSAGKVASGIMVAGGILDITMNVMDNREAKKMQEQQEKNLKEQEKQQNKKKRRYRRRSDMHPLSTRNVVSDMFNQATNHTSYGASKLPGL